MGLCRTVVLFHLDAGGGAEEEEEEEVDLARVGGASPGEDSF
jgi:hypothetical protein